MKVIFIYAVEEIVVPHRAFVRRLSGLALAVTTVMAAAACSTAAPEVADSSTSGRTIQVVAAENFWGSIASQLGGDHVKVTNIISNPDADPHDYEPTAADARTVAGAQYTIVNGIGYDAWADKLLSANPTDGRTDLTIGDLVGIQAGGNPHRWYSPATSTRSSRRSPPTTSRWTRPTPPTSMR